MSLLDQLKYYDSLAIESIMVGVVDGTRQADLLILEQLKNYFVETVNDFQDKSNKKYDESGTDDFVINPLDPHLYCSVSDVTCISDWNIDDYLLNIGNGRSQSSQRTYYGLLSIMFHGPGQVKINSYINNVHPEIDANLYPLIERIFTCCLQKELDCLECFNWK